MRTLIYKGAFYKIASMTAEEMVAHLTATLDKLFPPKQFTVLVERGLHLVGEDSIVIHFYSRPRGTKGADLMNSAHSCKISISAGRSWVKDQPAPDKVKVELFSGHRYPKLRASTTTPDKALTYIVTYFTKNKKELTE